MSLTGTGMEKGTGTFWQYICIGTGTKIGTGIGNTITWGFQSASDKSKSTSVSLLPAAPPPSPTAHCHAPSHPAPWPFKPLASVTHGQSWSSSKPNSPTTREACLSQGCKPCSYMALLRDLIALHMLGTAHMSDRSYSETCSARGPSDKLTISRGTGAVPQEVGSRCSALRVSPFVLMEMGSLPPVLPCVPCTALRLLNMLPNTQPLCTTFQAGFTFSLEQEHVTCLPKRHYPCNPAVMSSFPTCLTSFGLHFYLAGNAPVLH